MNNPRNKQFVETIVTTVQELEYTGLHNALAYDLYQELKRLVNKYGEDYPRCGTCRRPASGVSFGCGECYQRRPDMYTGSYRGRTNAYNFEGMN